MNVFVSVDDANLGGDEGGERTENERFPDRL